MSFTKDKISILRTLISLASVDKKMHAKELLWLQDYCNKQDFGEEDRRVINQDFLNPTNYKKNFSKINHYYDRVKVLEMARVVLHLDGHYSPKEKEAFLYLRDEHKRKSKNIEKSFKALGVGLVKSNDRINLYKELNQLGGVLSQRPKRFLYILFPNLWIYKNLIFGGRFFVLFYIFFALAIIGLYLLII